MVNEKIKNLVMQNDPQGLVQELVALIRNDRRFKTSDFDDAWTYVKKCMSDFGQPFDGESFADESGWDEDYLAQQVSKLSKNFCQERIDHIKEVSHKVYGIDAGRTAQPQADVPAAPERKADTSFLAAGNPHGKVSAKLKKDVAEGNVRHAVNDLLIIIHNDRGLYTSEFADSLAYVRAAGLDVEVPFDGGDFADRSQWDSDYWASQMTELRFNFCVERIAHVRDIGRKLWPKRPQQYTQLQASGEPQGRPYRRQTYTGGTNGNFSWKMVGGIAVAIIILGVILFSGRQ